MIMYYIGSCPVCEQGNLGIRICSGLQHGIVLCDECDAMWLDADLSRPPFFLNAPRLPCLHCGASLVNSPAHWATWDEILRLGWQSHVVGSGAALGEQSTDECGSDNVL
jgi:hypothetical protein